MGRVSTCQKNCKTIDLRGAQVNKQMQKLNHLHAKTDDSDE